MPDVLAQRRILIVEDEFLNALMLEKMVVSWGGTVLGPVASVEAALGLLEAGPVDAAILDVNLSGTPVYPVIDALDRRGVPLVLTTGYDAAGLREDLRHHLYLQKPFREPDLLDALRRIFQDASAVPFGS